MDLQLHDKVALVTGASRGIGRSIAQTLAAGGMRLVVVARSGDGLEETAGGCATDCLRIARDLRDPEAATEVVAAAFERFGRLDLLVNNAGATRRGDFLALPEADWADGFALKFFGAVRLCRAAWPHLRQAGGCIINIAGIGGRTGSAEFTIGGAVNAALLNFTKALADRGRGEGVRVVAINPGSIATERLQARIRARAEADGVDEAEAARRMVAAQGVARFGSPEEIAQVVAFLASPLAGYCQGAIVDVDGGQTRTL